MCCVLYVLCSNCYVVLCFYCCLFFFFFKQKTAYEMRISDWSSNVCSSDLPAWPIWDKRVAAVRSGGLITQVPIVYPAWFSGAVDQGLLDLAESMILATTVAGFTGAVAAIKGHDARSLLPQVETPTLVIAGANDAAVPPEA